MSQLNAHNTVRAFRVACAGLDATAFGPEASSALMNSFESKGRYKHLAMRTAMVNSSLKLDLDETTADADFANQSVLSTDRHGRSESRASERTSGNKALDRRVTEYNSDRIIVSTSFRR